MSAIIPPIDGSLVGTKLTATINDRLRRIQTAFATASGDSVLPQLILSVPGTLAVNANAAPLVSIATDGTLSSIVALVKTAPTGASLKFVVKAGALVLGGGAIAIGATAATVTATAVLKAGVVVTLAITQVGSGVAGADLTVMVRF